MAQSGGEYKAESGVTCETKTIMTSGYNVCLGSDRFLVLQTDIPNLNPVYSMFSLCLRFIQIVCQHQSGFRKQHNTKTAAPKVVNVLYIHIYIEICERKGV